MVMVVIDGRTRRWTKAWINECKVYVEHKGLVKRIYSMSDLAGLGDNTSPNSCSNMSDDPTPDVTNFPILASSDQATSSSSDVFANIKTVWSNMSSNKPKLSKSSSNYNTHKRRNFTHRKNCTYYVF